MPLMMTDAELTIEQSNALISAERHHLTLLDPVTNRRYVIVDEKELAKLETQQAIRSGIDQIGAITQRRYG